MELAFIREGIAAVAAFFAQPPLSVIFELFFIFLWTGIAWLLIYLAFFYLEDLKSDKYTENWKWTLLAIDIPAMNIQTPKAVEQMFAHIAGAFEQPGIRDLYKYGFKQRWFSFEIISIEGYIQFLIRTEDTFRDLVEGAVYAQYPDAEIIEVEDYTEQFDGKFPNDEYDMWAGDFALTEHDAFPIRTYREFEHSISKDTVLKDPMGTFLESFSRIGSGEQMWFQIILQPISNSWKENSIKKIKEMIGEKAKSKNGISDIMTSAPMKLLEGIGDEVFGREASVASAAPEREGPPNQLQYLTPGQSKIVEAMEEKISKLGFKTKMRGLYLARKEVFRPQRGVNALIGAINQFNIPSANTLEPVFTTGAPTPKQQNQKKNLLMKAYQKRKMKVGANAYVLNIEELATVWHFPMSHVKTPMLQKATLKTSEPPSSLPIEQILAGGQAIPIAGDEALLEQGDEPAPQGERKAYLTDTGDVAYDEGVEFG